MHTENLTILFVDIAGFTATTNRQSRRQNASLLQNFESLLKPQIKKFSGQLVKSIGDALLLTFRSPTDAMLCACRMQDRLAWYNQQNPQAEPIVIRVAAHLGEVRVARHDVFGEAVNLASRIEAVTPPGEIYLSEAVYLAMNKTEVRVSQAGHFELDGFAHQLTLYRVCANDDTALRYGSNSEDFKSTTNYRLWLLAGLLLVPLIAVGVYLQQFEQSLPAYQGSTTTSQNSKFVSLNLQDIGESQLNAAEQFGLQHSLQQAVQRLSGLYLHEPSTQSAADYQLTAQWRDGVFPQPDQISFTLREPGHNNAQSWTVDWLPQQTAGNLKQASQQLVVQLAATGTFKELYAAENTTQVPDSFYQQYLLALRDLLQAEQSQDTKLRQNSIVKLQQIHQTLPDFHQVQRALCQALTFDNDVTLLAQAASVCKSLNTSNASVSDLLVYGRYLTLTQDKKAALQVLLTVLSKDPKSGEAYSMLSSLYLADNQPLEAELVLKRAMTVQPNYWPAIQKMAVFQLEQGRISEAIDLFQQALLLTPDNATALTNLGSAYLLNGQLQAAADAYQQALQKNAEPFMQANLATVYYYLGRVKEAIRLYQQALQQNQTDFQLHGNIADAYRQNHQQAEAELHYQQAISLTRELKQLDARQQALQAHYLSQLGQQQEAVETMTQAIKQNAESAEVWLLDALLQTKLGQHQTALNSAKQAVQFGYPVKLLAVDPDLQPLASDPSFLALLQHNMEK